MTDTAVNKVVQWLQFSGIVREHISQYGVAQYGDFPDEMIADYTVEKIQSKLEHYVKRMGKGARGHEEQLRDAKKIAHYSCYLYALLKTGSAQGAIDE